MKKGGRVRRHLKVWMAASDQRKLVGLVQLSRRRFKHGKGSSVQMG
jgi:hypothetical protein